MNAIGAAAGMSKASAATAVPVSPTTTPAAQRAGVCNVTQTLQARLHLLHECRAADCLSSQSARAAQPRHSTVVAQVLTDSRSERACRSLRHRRRPRQCPVDDLSWARRGRGSRQCRRRRRQPGVSCAPSCRRTCLCTLRLPAVSPRLERQRSRRRRPFVTAVRSPYFMHNSAPGRLPASVICISP